MYCTYMGLLHVLFVWACCVRFSILVKGKVEVVYVIITSKVIVTGEYVLLHTVQYVDNYFYIKYYIKLRAYITPMYTSIIR